MQLIQKKLVITTLSCILLFSMYNTANSMTTEELKQKFQALDSIDSHQVYEMLQSKHGINTDYKATSKLQQIMSRLTNVIDDPTMYNKPYKYFVNNENYFNAFCSLGHNLTVNIGTFTALNFHTDELAFVVAHELSHGKHGDPLKNELDRLTMSEIKQKANEESGALEKIFNEIVYSNSSAKGITLPNEKRADEEAFEYCAKAGYNIGAGAALYQRIIDNTSTSKKIMNYVGNTSEYFILFKLFSPNDHPDYKQRRDMYSNKLTVFSNGIVKVDSSNGRISVNNKDIGIPAAAFNQTSTERAYIVAGDMARAYRNCPLSNLKPRIIDGQIYIGDYAILTITQNDNSKDWIDNLNIANGFAQEANKSLWSKTLDIFK